MRPLHAPRVRSCDILFLIAVRIPRASILRATRRSKAGIFREVDHAHTTGAKFSRGCETVRPPGPIT